MYGNLRTENIIIKLDRMGKNILQVKFLGFGSLVSIEESDLIRIPDRIDHLPPDMTSYLVDTQRFTNKNTNASQMNKKAKQSNKNNNKLVNVKFLR